MVFSGLVLAVVLAWFAVANNAGAMGFIARKVLARVVSPVKVNDLRFGALAYTFPSTWIVKEGVVRVTLDGKPAEVSVAEVNIRHAGRLLSGGQGAGIAWHGADIVVDQLKVNGLSGTLELERVYNGLFYHGGISAVSGSWDQFSAAIIKAAFTGDARALAFDHITADVYGGQLSGDVRVVFGDVPGYSIDAVVEKVDTALLESALGGVFQEIGGRLSGQVHLAGRGMQVRRVEAAWGMPSGGRVSAALLSSLMAYLPSSSQKRKVAALIRSGGKLAVEVFSFTIKNDAPDHLSGTIGLKSREANIELNISHEVRVDTRLDALLRAWTAVLNQ